MTLATSENEGRKRFNRLSLGALCSSSGPKRVKIARLLQARDVREVICVYARGPLKANFHRFRPSPHVVFLFPAWTANCADLQAAAEATTASGNILGQLTEAEIACDDW